MIGSKQLGSYDDFGVHVFIEILEIGWWNESKHH